MIGEVNIERAQEAARAVIGVGPDPRDYFGEYLTVDARALARLLNALQMPYAPVRGEHPDEVNDAPA